MSRTRLQLRPLAAVPESIVALPGAERAPGAGGGGDHLLDGVHRRCADLHLLFAPGGEQCSRVDARRQVGIVHEHAVATQDMGDEVVGEDRQPVEIPERSEALAAKGELEIGGGELRSTASLALSLNHEGSLRSLTQPTLIQDSDKFGNSAVKPTGLIEP